MERNGCLDGLGKDGVMTRPRDLVKARGLDLAHLDQLPPPRVQAPEKLDALADGQGRAQITLQPHLPQHHRVLAVGLCPARPAFAEKARLSRIDPGIDNPRPRERRAERRVIATRRLEHHPRPRRRRPRRERVQRRWLHHHPRNLALAIGHIHPSFRHIDTENNP